MVRYLLDTDTLSLLQQAHPRVLTRTVAEPTGTVGLTTITIEEQFLGWIKKDRSARQPRDVAHASRRLSEAIHLWARFPILPQTEPSLARYESLIRMKLNVGGPDLRIAAIALEHTATVVSANTRDFSRVPGLAVVDWSV